MTDIIIQFVMKMWWVWLVFFAFLAGAWFIDERE